MIDTLLVAGILVVEIAQFVVFLVDRKKKEK